HLKIGVSVRHIFKPISYLEIQLLSGVSGGYISQLLRTKKVKVPGSRTGLMAYGWVDVQGGSNYANCRIR
ncbi:hypothetical protein RF039_10680, partial [Enterobacter sichuanensis]|nr:hypothetical protein [Enterobacter sichuanensis]